MCVLYSRTLFFILSIYNSFSSGQFSRSVVSDSLRPHESQHARPPCPSPTPGVHSDSRPSNSLPNPYPTYLDNSNSVLFVRESVSVSYIGTPVSLSLFGHNMQLVDCIFLETSISFRLLNLFKFNCSWISLFFLILV